MGDVEATATEVSAGAVATLRERLDALDHLGELVQQAGATIRATAALVGNEILKLEADVRAELEAEQLTKPFARTPDPAEASSRRPENTLADYLQSPLVYSGQPDSLVIEMAAQLGESGARLVTLLPTTSAVALRAELPRGLAVQPDGDGANTSLVLVYRYVANPPNEQALRVYYRLVDLLALLAPSGCLDPEKHSSLERLLPGLPLAQDGLQEHVSARAKWRRTVPARAFDLDGPLARMSLPARTQLAYLLIQVSGQDPRTGAQLPALIQRFQLPMPSELRVDDGVAELLGRLLGYPNGAAPAEPLGPVPSVPAPRSEKRVRVAAPAEARIDDGGNLTGAVLALAHLLAQHEQHALAVIADTADQLNLGPLQAVRTINEWARQRSIHWEHPPDAFIQVDEGAGTVLVEPELRQLLS